MADSPDHPTTLVEALAKADADECARRGACPAADTLARAAKRCPGTRFCTCHPPTENP